MTPQDEKEFARVYGGAAFKIVLDLAEANDAYKAAPRGSAKEKKLRGIMHVADSASAFVRANINK